MAKATSRKSSESIPRSSMTWLSGEMFSRGMSQISEMMSATVSKVDAMTFSSFRRAQATYRLAAGLSTLAVRSLRDATELGVMGRAAVVRTSSVERVRIGAHDELLVRSHRLGVLPLDPPHEVGGLALVGVPAREELDQPSPLALRLLARRHGALPLVARHGWRRGDRGHAAAAREDGVPEPARVAILDLGEVAQRRRHLRVARVLGGLAQPRCLLRLGAVCFHQVGDDVARLGGAQQAREQSHAPLARSEPIPRKSSW